MKKMYRHISLFFSLLGVGFVLSAQNDVNSGTTFRGVIGGSGKHTAIMVSSIPHQQMIAECTFFKGDSLAGFDFDGIVDLAAQDGVRMYGEFKGFIFKRQAEFVKKKYNISTLPFETAATSQKKYPPVVITAACNNLDFENGDFSGWTSARGYNANSNLPLTVMASPANLGINQDVHSCEDFNIISAAYGNDPYSGFPGLDPAGGTYSARVGGMDLNTAANVPIMLCDAIKYMFNGVNIPSNSNGQVLSQTFVVSAANALITYDYSVVLNAGGHANGEQPYFHVSVTDVGGTILNPCTEYYVQGAAGVPPPGFVNVGTVNPQDGSALYVQDWVSNSVNLTPFIGQTVTLKFEAAGCIYGGHMAWAYIEATCGPVDITLAPPNPCIGGTAVFTAPEVHGGAYSWIGPGIVGPATSQSVTVNASGTYSVVITPSQGAACSYTLSSSVTFNSPSISSTTATVTNCTSPSGTATANGTGGTGSYTYVWSPGGQTTSTATGLSAGNYTVTITDGNGCTAVATQSVSSYPPIVAGYSVTTVCLGNPTQFTDQSSATATSWSWNFGDGNTSIQQSPSHTYTLSGTFTATLVSTGPGGCNSTITHSVIVNPQPVANFSVTTVCFGNATQFTDLSAGGGTQWNWNFGDGNTSTQQSPSNIYSATGTYTATLISTGPGGCNSTISKAVTVYPQPVAGFSVTTVCLGNPTQFSDLSTGGATSWNWSFGDGNTSTQQSPSHTYTASGTYSVTLLSTANPGGCNSILTQVVTVNPLPVADFSITTVCFGNATQFTDLTSGGATQWSWNFGDGNTSTQQSPSNTYTSPGTYTATLLATAIPGGCNSTVSKIVIVNPQPIASFSATTVCLGNPTQFSDLTTGGGNQWNWDFGDGNTSTQQNPLNTYTASGTYSVTLISIDSPGGCNSTFNLAVVVNPQPIANFSVTTVCLGLPTQFTDLSTGGGTQWSWNFGDGNTSTQQNPSNTYTAAGTYTATLTSTGPGGCNSVFSQQVNIFSLSVANFSVSDICLNTNPAVFTDLSAGAAQWTWNFGDGTPNSSLQSPTHIYGAPGTYTVSLLVQSGGACKDSITHTINVNPVPDAIFTSNVVCFNNPTQFTDQSLGAPTQWFWDFGDGNNGTGQNPAHTYGAPGTYTVTLIAINSLGCSDTLPLTALVNPLPAANFIAQTVCVGSVTCFKDTTTITSGVISNWSWNFNDPNSGSSNISNIQHPCHLFTAIGTYNVILTATSNNGCQSTITLAVNVTLPPVASFSVNTVCLNSPTQFTDLSTGAIQWSWNFGDGGLSNLQNPSHVYLGFGSYVVTLVASAGGTCTDTITDTITVSPLPIVIFKSDTVCVGKPTSFTDASFMPAGSITNWVWNFGDPVSGINNTSSLQNPTHIFSAAGTYSVTLTATSAAGCQSSKVYVAVVFPGPNAEFTFSPASPVNLTEVITFTDQSAGSPVQWWWNFGDGDTSIFQNPEHHYSELGTYTITLIAMTQNGCTDTVQHPLEILQFAFYIPNAFTPGIDGKNDYFFGKGVGIVEYELIIFDRWGNQIFYCNIKDLPQTLPCMWDGKVEAGGSNERVQQDVYVWKVKLLDIFGESHKYIGTVTVVK